MKKVIGFIIVLLLSFLTVKPLFTEGYFPMHDDTQVARVIVMGNALREGQFPVRWVSDLGYGLGYPLFNFYAPLPYYVGGFLYALGVSGLVATKIMMGAGLVLAGLMMYIAVSSLGGIVAGILAATFYMFAPYHAVDAYVRGAVGEYWGLVFLPLIYLGYAKKRTVVGALGLAGLILSHTILGYIGIMFAVAGALVMKARRDLIFMVLLGLGLSSFFWLPALFEMGYTNVKSVIGTSANFNDHFVCVSQLWNSSWGFGGSSPGCLDGLSFKLGKVHIFAALIGLVGALLLTKTKIIKGIVLSGLLLLVFSIFFMLPASTFLWNLVPLFSFVQYPWRFLTFAVFGLSLMTVGVLAITRNFLLRIIVVTLALGAVVLVEGKRFTPQYTYTNGVSSFETKEDIRYRASKVSDEYLPPGVTKPVKLEDAMRDTITTSDSYKLKTIQNTDTYKKFEFLSGGEHDVVVRLAYFPGWTFMVNEFKVTPPLEGGLPVIRVPAGLTVVQLRFTDTPIRTFSNMISLLSLGVIIYLYDRKNKKTIR